MSFFRIVLIEPEIPQNTGNIGRLCAASGLRLALVGSLGFRLDDKHLKRAGMDYWDSLKLERIKTVDEYLACGRPFALISTKGKKVYSNIYNDFANHADYDIVFGSEGAGLPKFMYEKYPDLLYRIPMLKNVRSLNLSSAAAIVAYSLLEKNSFEGLEL